MPHSRRVSSLLYPRPKNTLPSQQDPDVRKPAEEDNTERRRDAPSTWQEQADEYRAKQVYHSSAGSLGFYEWVELLIRIAADRNPKESVSWTFDKLIKDAVPEGCAKHVIPPGMPGSGTGHGRPGSRQQGGGGSQPVRGCCLTRWLAASQWRCALWRRACLFSVPFSRAYDTAYRGAA